MNVSIFPPPPIYYKLYDDATRQVNVTRSDGDDNDNDNDDGDDNVVDDGSTLDDRHDSKIWRGQGLPPPKPVYGMISVFGEQFVFEEKDHLPTLDESGCTKLFQDDDDVQETASSSGAASGNGTTTSGRKKIELKKLNHSLLFSFLQLIDVLVNDPDRYGAKVEDIEILLMNMYNLINSYRPLEARHTLSLYLDAQSRRHRRTVERMQAELESNARTVLQGVAVDIGAHINAIERFEQCDASVDQASSELSLDSASASSDVATFAADDDDDDDDEDDKEEDDAELPWSAPKKRIEPIAVEQLFAMQRDLLKMIQ
jgi:mediator of RNA polymerase II transcription subunit 7